MSMLTMPYQFLFRTEVAKLRAEDDFKVCNLLSWCFMVLGINPKFILELDIEIWLWISHFLVVLTPYLNELDRHLQGGDYHINIMFKS